mgnify:CR=1 FL=1
MAGEIIDVLLVDDHTVARNGVRLMLGSAPDIRVTGEAENAQQALERVRERRFDVVLADIAMPGGNGLDLLQALHAERPGLPVLVLSTYAEAIYAVRALKLGAAGYLTKDTSTASLVEAVRKAAYGGKYVSPSVMERIAGMLGGGRTALHEALSNRELEVLKMIAEGKSLGRIADTLGLSPKTVTTYRARILDKLGVRSNAELARYAAENGLLM